MGVYYTVSFWGIERVKGIENYYVPHFRGFVCGRRRNDGK